MSAPVCVLHHHIGAESDFERGLSVTSCPDAYAAQIEYLSREFDIIDLDTLIAGKLPRRPLLLTFDDAFRSVLCVAEEILYPKSLPAVFFVNPGIIEWGQQSLDGVLAWAANTAGLDEVCAEIGTPPRTRIADVVVGDVAALGARERAILRERILSRFGPPDVDSGSPLLKPADLAALRRLGIEIGNHTATHVHCRALNRQELHEEVVQAKETLEKMSGAPVRAFSVPYGEQRDLTPELLGVLRETGHQAIFLVHARSNIRRPAPDIWYRTSLRNESPRDLRWKLQFLPAIRTLKHRLLG